MTDEQTAAAIVAEYAAFPQYSSNMEAAIVRALQQARKEGGKQVVDEAERVSQILQSVNTSNSDNEAKARFEVDRFAFACAGSIVGSTLTDYQKHALFHQFKNVFDSHDAALQQARESAFMAHVADQSTRNYCHTASDVSDALCREMEASNIMGSHLWWGEMYRRIGLELCCAFNAGRADALVDQKPPPGHIIDDQGVVRKVDTTGWDPADTSKPVPLPVYADGELWMMGEEAFTIVDNEVRIIYTYDHCPSWTSSGWVIRWGDGEIELNKCYANSEAAEAAKEDER